MNSYQIILIDCQIKSYRPTLYIFLSNMLSGISTILYNKTNPLSPIYIVYLLLIDFNKYDYY
jgi:hypothetical protein